MAITREEVLHVARLARLSLPEAEADRLREQLSVILDYVRQLDLLDTRDVVPEGGARLDGVGRGDDVAGVEPVELLHVVENGRELPAKALCIRLRQRKARQTGDVQHLFPRDRHRTSPRGVKT